MKFKYIIYYIIFSLEFFNCIYGQDLILVDSLLQKIETIEDTTQTLKNYEELSWQFLKLYDTSQARVFSQKGIDLANAANEKKWEATFYSRLGDALQASGNNGSALNSFETSLSISQSVGFPHGIARAYNHIGIIRKNQGQLRKGLEYFQKSAKIFDENSNNSALSTVFNNIGQIHLSLGAYKLSIEYFLNSFKIRQIIEDDFGIAESLNNLGRVYERLFLNEIALSSYKDSYRVASQKITRPSEPVNFIAQSELRAYSSLNIANIFLALQEFDSSYFYLERSKKVGEKIIHPNFNGSILYNEARLRLHSDSLEQIKTLIDSSVLIFKNTSNNFELARSYGLLGEYFLKIGEIKNAKENLKSSLSLAIKFNDPFIQLNRLVDLSETYFLEGNQTLALHYLRQSKKLEDSLNLTKRRAIEFERFFLDTLNTQKQLQLSNQVLKKDLALLEVENRQKKQQTYGMAILSTLLLLTGIAISLGIRNRQKARIAHGRIDQLIYQQELKITSVALEAQDEERRRIAQDLHDQIGSMLSMVKVSFHSLEESLIKAELRNSEQYRKTTKLLDQTVLAVRDISRQIGNSTLTNLGIVPALEDLLNTLEESGMIKTELIVVEMEERLSRKVESNLFKILQELLANIMKHAQATEIILQLIKDESQLNVTLEDNGIGFNPKEVKSKGMGLKNVESRLHEIEGSVDIDSGKGSGTTIIINIPVSKLT